MRRTTPAAVAMAILVAGCGGGQAPAPPPPEPAPAADEARPAPPPGPKPADGSPKRTLSAGDPRKLEGDPVPVRYLPEGFSLPAGATVREGFGEYRPNTGQFYLEVDAPIDAVSAFFEREYAGEGWKKTSDETSEENGRQGFDLLFTRRNSQQGAGFTGEERGGRTIVQVYYNDNSKL